MAKYDRFATVLETRIRQGDYVLRDLPTEQQLADEVGVSRMTARRALLQLMAKGLLVRKPHGKLEVSEAHVSGPANPRIAFLAPAFSSPDFETWRFAVECAASKFSVNVRAVDFVHWNDPVIPQTLSSFDGVFLVPSSETIPQVVIDRLSKAGNVVVLDGDLTASGIPSVDLLPAQFIGRLGDHLLQLGHRDIDCLNTQPVDDVTKRRIDQWRFWQQVHKVDGRVINEPVEPFEQAIPKAYSTMKRLLDAGEFKATALVCITGNAAIGATRALHEAGLKVGQDVSVCAMNDMHAKYYVPSLTVLEAPGAEPFLEVCLDWFMRRKGNWVGPLLIQATNVPLMHGESTGPVKVD